MKRLVAGLESSPAEGPRHSRSEGTGSVVGRASGLLASLLSTGFLLAEMADPARGAEGETAPIFHDIAVSAGVEFHHDNGMTGELFFPEMTGPGCGFLDYDGDGDLDLYFVQGGPLSPAARQKGALRSDRLFRSLLAESGELRFEDVTDRVGLGATGYGMGVATGDYDGDGWIDLYLTNYGANQLLRNQGGESFRDVTAAAGLAGSNRWSTGATFFDFDRDGDLDLYVVNYVEFSVADNPACYTVAGRRDYCGPTVLPASADRLYRNLGDGTFAEMALPGSPAEHSGAGLGVISFDSNSDGWIDLYVANDGMANYLWLNQGDGTFRDEALFTGIAVNSQGKPEASMGVDAADIDADGDEDIFVAHLAGETNTLYLNQGDQLFEDRTVEIGLGHPSLAFTAFGTAFFDYDMDGRLDLAVVNGAVRSIEAQLLSGRKLPLAQTNQLFHNTPHGFEETTELAGAAFLVPEVSRGLAVGDVDNDGDPDLLMVNNGGPARLLLNSAGDRQPWLGLRLVNGAGRDQLGAWVGLHRRGQPSLWRRVRTDGSYASARDPRVRFGLAEGADVKGIEVLWPDGRRDGYPAPEVGRYWTISSVREEE